MNHSFLRFCQAFILRIALLATALSISGVLASTKTRHEIAPDEMLHIRLYDRARIPAGTLQCAIIETSRIFKATKIKLEWERPSVESPEDCGVDFTSPAARRTHAERQYLVIKILPTVAATVAPGALGFALPYAEAGAHITLFYDRVAATARDWGVAPYVALGCVMAHEVGHVLLRSSGHSSIGLMQPRWNEVTWHLVSQGLLGFLPEEKARMRQRVLRFSSP